MKKMGKERDDGKSDEGEEEKIWRRMRGGRSTVLIQNERHLVRWYKIIIP